MAKMIFVNLPVADVAASTAFYEALGLAKNDAFSNEKGSSFQWSDTISFQVLEQTLYNTLTPKRIADPRAVSHNLIALGFESRAEVDAFVEAALANGGKELHPAEDEGFMYSRAFEDPDGHGFGPFYMDLEAAMATTNQAEPAAA